MGAQSVIPKIPAGTARTSRDFGMTSNAVKLAVLRLWGAACCIPLLRGRLTIGEFLYGWLSPTETVVRTSIGSLAVEVDLTEPQGRFIFFRGYERAEVAFLRRQLKPGDVAVDVGAHVGFLTAIMANAVGPNGRVYAFEPDPRSFARLAHMAALETGRIEARRTAVLDHAADAIGAVRFYSDPAFPMYSTSRSELAGAHARELEVPATSLDAFFRQERVSRVDFVKIDVEGAEGAVIEGMLELFQDGYRPAILCELRPGAWSSARVDTLRILTDLGYQTYGIRRSGRLVSVDPAEIREHPGTLNIVFLTGSQACRKWRDV